MQAFGKVLYLTACCILFAAGYPSIHLTVTSHGRSGGNRPEVYTKQDGHGSTPEVKFNIPEDVIEKMLPYEAEEAIVTRERMDVSKWGKNLPKIKAENRRQKKYKSDNEFRKRKRKGKRKHSKGIYSKGKGEQDRRGHRQKNLKKRKNRFKNKLFY